MISRREFLASQTPPRQADRRGDGTETASGRQTRGSSSSARLPTNRANGTTTHGGRQILDSKASTILDLRLQRGASSRRDRRALSCPFVLMTATSCAVHSAERENLRRFADRRAAVLGRVTTTSTVCTAVVGRNPRHFPRRAREADGAHPTIGAFHIPAGAAHPTSQRLGDNIVTST